MSASGLNHLDGLIGWVGIDDRIAEAIRESGKTKAQIARECEVTGGAVSQWLSGSVKSLKADTALSLEQATGYRAYWILHGRGAKKLNDPQMTWPFQKVSIERFMGLDDGDRGYVERRLLQAIEECESHAQPEVNLTTAGKPPTVEQMTKTTHQKRTQKA